MTQQCLGSRKTGNRRGSMEENEEKELALKKRFRASWAKFIYPISIIYYNKSQYTTKTTNSK